MSASSYQALVTAAAESFAGRLRTTPIEHSPQLSEMLGIDVFLKLECLQVTGSFKVRGAWARLSSLSLQEAERGVATCSAGNHGIAVAYAARHFGIRAVVFLPSQADPSKQQAIERLGARVIRSRLAGFDEVEPEAMATAADMNLVWVSAFDDDHVMAGNGGTLGLEVCRQIPECRSWLVPVGGGGLSAGLARYLSANRRPFAIIACQHERSPALLLSLKRGEAVTRMPPLQTWAGGIEGGIGARTFPYLKRCLQPDQVALLNEDELLDAVRWLLRENHYLIEPSAAAPLAACLTEKVGRIPGPAVVVLTGRNLAFRRLQAILGSLHGRGEDS